MFFLKIQATFSLKCRFLCIIKDEINEGGFLIRNWTTIKEYDEILFEQAGKVAKITINRPHVHNAFTPKTVMEMIDAFTH